LYVTPRGLTTSSMPLEDGRSFEIEFDFCTHRLRITLEGGKRRDIALEPKSVATFYGEVQDAAEVPRARHPDLAGPGRDR
jgi:hypothetical protein